MPSGSALEGRLVWSQDSTVVQVLVHLSPRFPGEAPGPGERDIAPRRQGESRPSSANVRSGVCQGSQRFAVVPTTVELRPADNSVGALRETSNRGIARENRGPL